MTSSLEALLEFALDVVDGTDQLAMSFYKKEHDVQFKNDRSPVTKADRAVEAYIRKAILEEYPSHEIVGEEFGENDQKSSHRWIIDPIDGTKSFMRNIPTFSTLLGLEIYGEIKLGIASFPALDERIYAIDGGGTWWIPGKHMAPISAHASTIPTLSEGMVMTTDVSKMDTYGKTKAWQKIKETAKSCLGYGDAYGYMLVATGRAELMLDPGMSVWDCGPMPVLLNEAGAYFGDWYGNKTIYANEAVATTNTLFEEVMGITHLDKK